MKRLTSLAIALLLPIVSYGATKDTVIHVNLLPGTDYSVTADVSTTALNSLLDLLLTGTTSPIQILDQNGNILGELTNGELSDLLGGLGGLLGDVVKQVTIPLDGILTPVTDLVVRTLDGPIIKINNVGVSTPAPRDRRPTVKVVRVVQQGNKLIVRGTAADDNGVKKIEVIDNKHQHIAKGKGTWSSKFRLKKGVHKVKVRSVDTASQLSVTKRFKVTRTK